MKRTLAIVIAAASTLSLMAVNSILEIKHSLTDDNIIPPESFETMARDLEESFYLRHYAAGESAADMPQVLGTPQEYEERLSKMPTEIEMPYNSVVGKYIDMYVGKRRGMVSDLLALQNYYGNIFIEELEKQGMPLELQYLPVIESALKPNAVSRAGAGGLWQFMPATARGLGMEVNSLVDERRDPRSASRNAARYLKELYGIYGDWSLAIAAYNCGPGNVNKALRRAGGGKKDFWEIYRFLPAETRGYVPAFIAATYAMTNYKHHNIKPRVITKHLVTDTVMVNKRVHFNQIAAVLNIPVDEIRMLNPQYRKDVIPGDIKPYPLVLPSQQVLSYVMSEDRILAYDADIYRRRTYVEPVTASAEDGYDDFYDPGAIQPEMEQSVNANENLALEQSISDKPTQQTHIVGRGESLRDVARKYGVSATDIKRWNSLRRGKIKEGDKLIIETYESQYNITSVPVTHKDKGLTASTSAVPMPKPKTVEELPAVPPRQEQPRQQQTMDVPAPAAQQPAAEKASVPQRRVYGTNTAVADMEQVAPRPVTAAKESAKKPAVEKKSANDAKQSKAAASKKDAKSKKQQSKSYTVKSGDTLDKIARRNGTTVSALQKANKIKGSNIRPGQKLTIPSKK